MKLLRASTIARGWQILATHSEIPTRGGGGGGGLMGTHHTDETVKRERKWGRERRGETDFDKVPTHPPVWTTKTLFNPRAQRNPWACTYI